MAAGQIEEARGTYRQVLVLLDRLRERNVWTCASGFTAGLVLGDQARMETYLRALKEIALTPEEAESVQRGVKEVAKGIDADRNALVGLYEALDLQAGEP